MRFALMCTLALAVAAMGVPAAAQSPNEAASASQAESSKAEVDDKSRQLLKQMSDHFADARTIQVAVKATADIEMPGRSQSQTTGMTFDIAKPDRFRVDVTRGRQLDRVVADGNHIYEYAGRFNQYRQRPSPEDNPLDHQMMGMLLEGALVKPDPWAAFSKSVNQIEYAGRDSADGDKLHKLRVTAPDGEFDMFLTDADKPVIHHIRIDQSDQLRRSGGEGSVVVTIRFNEWKLGEPIEAGTFDFSVPEGAKKVSRIGPPHPLEDKPAPNFTLTNLAGEKVELSDLKGKVVVLDFWATWCGPCVKGLPIMDKVTSSYSDDKLAFYAVNLRENQSKVNKFLEKHDMDLPVLMDAQGSVARQYRVKSIPQTVIIGADGTVQSVHVGLSPNAESELKSELDKLVANVE